MRDISFRCAPPPIRARLLGPVDLRVGDRILAPGAWRRRPARRILLMLLGTPGHRLPRDVVLDALWPDHNLDVSLNSLYKVMHTLRRTLQPNLGAGQKSAYVEIGNDWIAIVPHDGLWVDADCFEHLVRQEATGLEFRETLHAALEFYRGDFMVDEPYADWPITRRESLRAARERAVLNLARIDLEQGDPLASLGHLEALLADDPASEEAHRSIIRALLARGQCAEALQQVERCRLALRRELDVALDPETEALAALARSAPARTAIVASDTGVPVLNLPGLPTATIGRERDIANVRALLAEGESRLVTISGTGGVGKTRLAIEIGRGAASRYADGVAFVALHSIRDQSLLYPAIAGVLGVSESPDRSLIEAVHDALRRRPRFLLVLDNLEHLPEVAVPVAELLAAVPSLTVLATSREPLRIRAERIYRLDPLAVPAADPSLGPEALREVDSVSLFLRCANAWGVDSRPVTDASLPLIAAVCRRLEGLPLAIELAAARVLDSGPATILAQLDDRFATLRDGPRDLPDRHRALRNTIGWSYDLLSASEQHLFRGLAVFAGGIEVDALQAIFGSSAMPLAEALVDKSLLQWDRRYGQQRLTMLESIRAFAAEMLEHHDELPERQLAHARFFADLAVRSGLDAAKRGPVQIDWMRRLERDQDNIHLALANCLSLGESNTALIFTNVMGRYWDTHLPAAEARAWIEQALALEPGGAHLSSGWAAIWGATFAWRMSDRAATIAFENEARRIWTILDSARGMAWVDYHVAERLGFEGRYGEMVAIHDANLEIFRREGDTEGIVHALVGIALGLGMTGQPGDVVAALDEALDVAREADNLILQSYLLSRLPTALLAAGEVERAAALVVEGERLARLIGDRHALPWAAVVQASLGVERGGDLASALQYAQAALVGFREAGEVKQEWIALMACTMVAVASGRLSEARGYALATVRSAMAYGGEACKATILPEIAGCLVALGDPAKGLIAFAAGLTRKRVSVAALPASSGERYAAGIRAARERLPDVEADAAWTRGATIDIDDTLELVRRHLEPDRVPDSAPV